MFFTFVAADPAGRNVPASAMVRVLDPRMVAFTLVGDGGAALGEPAVLPARAAVVPQREQLSRSADRVTRMTPNRQLAPEPSSKAAASRLTAAQYDQLWAYHRMLRAANAELNLTRIHNFENMVLKHYVDSLLVLKFERAAVAADRHGLGPRPAGHSARRSRGRRSR